MTEIRKSKQCLGLERLGFICNLVLGICDFRHRNPRQSPLSLTWPEDQLFNVRIKLLLRMARTASGGAGLRKLFFSCQVPVFLFVSLDF